MCGECNLTMKLATRRTHNPKDHLTGSGLILDLSQRPCLVICWLVPTTKQRTFQADVIHIIRRCLWRFKSTNLATFDAKDSTCTPTRRSRWARRSWAASLESRASTRISTLGYPQERGMKLYSAKSGCFVLKSEITSFVLHIRLL